MQAKTSLILLLFLILASCCHRTEKGYKETDVYHVDSIISLYKDSMLSQPVQMKNLLFDNRKGVSDSISYYKLTVFAGLCCYHNYQTDSAFLLNNEALAFCLRQDSTKPRIAELKAYAYNYLGIMLQETNRRDSALVCLLKAYHALSYADDRRKLPDICINIADNYAQSGDFPEATYYYRKALFASDSLNMGEQLNHAIYCGMARIYADIDNYSLAEHYYKLAEKAFDRISPYEQFFFANTRGNYYYITEQYAQALPWFYKSNRISLNLKKQIDRAITDSNLGEVYLLLGKPDSALHYLDKANRYFSASNPDESTVFYFNGLYASLALYQNNLKKAEELLSQPYDTATINPTYIYLHNKRMEELYAQKGDFRKAYEYDKKVQSYNDSIRNTKAINYIAEIDSRYRQDTTLLKRDILIAQNQTQALQFRNISILLTSILVIFTMAVILTVIYARRKREQRYVKQMATIIKLRMENVRNRISPHFIFNVLNVVIPALRPYDELVKPLHLLVQAIRNNLLVSEKIAITLSEEIEIVRNFLDLKQSINKEFPTIKWEMAEKVDMQTLIPSMIMQIPIENAIKYAFDAYEEGNNNSLTIKISETNEMLSIYIEDNGTGYNPDRFANSAKGTGTGLKVLFRTIDLLNTKNQQKIEFKIENLGTLSTELHGTKVSVIIPAKYNYNL